MTLYLWTDYLNCYGMVIADLFIFLFQCTYRLIIYIAMALYLQTYYHRLYCYGTVITDLASILLWYCTYRHIVYAVMALYLQTYLYWFGTAFTILSSMLIWRCTYKLTIYTVMALNLQTYRSCFLSLWWCSRTWPQGYNHHHYAQSPRHKDNPLLADLGSPME